MLGYIRFNTQLDTQHLNDKFERYGKDVGYTLKNQFRHIVDCNLRLTL